MHPGKVKKKKRVKLIFAQQQKGRLRGMAMATPHEKQAASIRSSKGIGSNPSFEKTSCFFSSNLHVIFIIVKQLPCNLPSTSAAYKKPSNSDKVVKKPKTDIVIPRSLRRGISSIRYYCTFRFTKRSFAALGMTTRIFYEGINKVFNSFRNYVFSQATAMTLYHAYSLKGQDGLAEAAARIVRPA